MKRRYAGLERVFTGLALAALSASCLGMSFTAARRNREGDVFFRKGDYENALKKYSEAMTDAPEKPQLYFNIGDVLYRQSKFPEAAKLFEKSAAPGDPSLQAKSWYNIGNAKFRAAAKPGAPGGAGEGEGPGALQEAAACYIKALEADPADMDAKYNLEFVQRVMQQQQQQQSEQQKQEKKEQEKKEQRQKEQKQQEEQKEQQQKEQEKKEQQKEQEKKEREKKEQEKKDQEKEQEKKEQQQQKEQEKQGQEQQQKEQEKKEQEKKEQEKKEQQQKEQEKKEREQEEQPAGAAPREEKSEQPEGGLSEQQAKALVESLDREERDPTNFIKAEGPPVPKEVEKDW